MRNVIRVPECTEKERECKPIELTHCKGRNGWEQVNPWAKPKVFNKIVYLGKCKQDGDMFATYYCDYISIYKGHLNSGKY
jgi:hypothetical protein